MPSSVASVGVGAGREQPPQYLDALAAALAPRAAAPGGNRDAEYRLAVRAQRGDPQRCRAAEIPHAGRVGIERAPPRVPEIFLEDRRVRDPRVRVGAAGKERLDERQPLALRQPAAPARRAVLLVPFGQPERHVSGRRVQRRHARHLRVRVGARFEQEVRELRLADDDGVRQHVRAVGTGGVDVDTGRQQRAGHLDVAVAGGDHQEGEPLGGRDVQLRAVLDQPVDDIGALRCHGPHQRGVAGRNRGGIDVGAVRQQQPDDLRVAGLDRRHQRRQPARLRRVRVGAGVEQAFDHARAGVLAGPRERRHAVVVGGVDVRARPEQEVDRLAVVPVRGVDQRRHAVRPCSIGVDARVEQRPDRRPVLIRGGVRRAAPRPARRPARPPTPASRRPPRQGGPCSRSYPLPHDHGSQKPAAPATETHLRLVRHTCTGFLNPRAGPGCGLPWLA